MKLVVENLPEDPLDCLFSDVEENDYVIVDNNVVHTITCSLKHKQCLLQRGDQCPYLKEEK